MTTETKRILTATKFHRSLSRGQRAELAHNLWTARRRGRRLMLRYSAHLGRDVLIYR